VRRQHTDIAIQVMTNKLSHAVGSLQNEMYSAHNTIAKYCSNSQQQSQLIKSTFEHVKASVSISTARLNHQTCTITSLNDKIISLSSTVAKLDG
jgi:hypothetical protein